MYIHRITGTIAMLLLIFFNISAQEQKNESPDSVRTETLNEVVVEGISQETSPTHSSYIPSQKVKNQSADGAALLLRMGIPQLNVLPDGSITTSANASVSVYINFIAANEADLRALNVGNVRKVEYMDFPTDPRFHGAQHVVNFIVEEYRYGGYTKLTDYTLATKGVNTSNSIYQRIAANKVTLDLYLSHIYSNIRHIGSTSLESFSIPGTDGNIGIFQREQRLIDSKNISTRLPLTLKVNYATDKMTVVNTVGYVFNTAPTQYRSGSLSLSSDPYEVFNYDTSTPSHSNTLVWNSSLYMVLGKGWTGGLDNFLSHTHRDEYSRYSSDYVETEIINNAIENAYNYSSNLTLRKQFGQSHSMNISAAGGVDYSRVNYAGSSPFKEHFASPFFSVAYGYNYNSEKLSLGASGGIQWQQFRVNGEKNSRLSPLVNANFTYSANQRNSTGLYLQYTKAYTGAAAYAPTVNRVNEFLYSAGNPALKGYDQLWTTLSHTWLPRNGLNTNFFVQYHAYFDRVIPIYAPYPEHGDAIVSQYRNNGNFHQWIIGANATLRLFHNKLMLNVNPMMGFYKSTGIWDKHFEPFYITAYAYYYFGDFNVGVYFKSPSATIPLDRPWYSKTKSYCDFSLGWGNGAFTATLRIRNPWRNSNRAGTREITTEYYDSFMWFYNSTQSRSVDIRVSYTIGYGKKVDRRNEVSGQSGASSAILSL